MTKDTVLPLRKMMYEVVADERNRGGSLMSDIDVERASLRYLSWEQV